MNRIAHLNFSVGNKLYLSYFLSSKQQVLKLEETALMHLVGILYFSLWPRDGGKKTDLESMDLGSSPHLALTGHITLDNSLLFFNLSFPLDMMRWLLRLLPGLDSLRG